MFAKIIWPMLHNVNPFSCSFKFHMLFLYRKNQKKSSKRCRNNLHILSKPAVTVSHVSPLVLGDRNATCPMRCCRTSLSAFALRDFGWRRPSGRTSTSVTHESPTTWEMWVSAKVRVDVTELDWQEDKQTDQNFGLPSWKPILTNNQCMVALTRKGVQPADNGGVLI